MGKTETRFHQCSSTLVLDISISLLTKKMRDQYCSQTSKRDLYYFFSTGEKAKAKTCNLQQIPADEKTILLDEKLGVFFLKT